MRKFFSSKSIFEIALVSAFALLVVSGVVLAATTIGTNITTGGSIYATSTLYVDGASTFTGDLSLATASSTGTVKFPTIDSDTTSIVLAATASTTGTAILRTATINSTTGAISFGDENLVTTGNIALATASSTGTVKFASISSDTGGVSFGANNLTTTGNIALATASSTGLVSLATTKVSSGGDVISDIQFGVCTVTIGSVAASSTAVATCAATGVTTSHRVFVTPNITNPSIILSSASSTADNVIQIAVYNTGWVGGTSGTAVDPADNSWAWMAIK